MFLLYPVPFRTLSDRSIIPLSIYILFPSPGCDLCVVYSLVPLLVCFFSLNINYGPQHFCLLPLLFCPFRSLLHTRNKDPVQSEGTTHKLKPHPYLLAPPTPSDHSSLHLLPPPKPSMTSLSYSATSYPSRTSSTCRLHAP